MKVVERVGGWICWKMGKNRGDLDLICTGQFNVWLGGCWSGAVGTVGRLIVRQYTKAVQEFFCKKSEQGYGKIGMEGDGCIHIEGNFYLLLNRLS